MMASLLSMYRKGAITADHLAVESLHLVDPEDPAPILSSLPDEILGRMIEFARQYRPNDMMTNYGAMPTTGQVEATKRWIEDSRRLALAGWAPPATP